MLTKYNLQFPKKGYNQNRIRDSASYVRHDWISLKLQLQPNQKSQTCQQMYFELATTHIPRKTSGLRVTQRASSSPIWRCLFQYITIPPQFCLFIAHNTGGYIK